MSFRKKTIMVTRAGIDQMLRILMARIIDAHRFALKTVHRTVFLTRKPSRVRFGKLPIYTQKSLINDFSATLVTRGGIEPPLPA